jgi:hypothetical protein
VNTAESGELLKLLIWTLGSVLARPWMSVMCCAAIVSPDTAVTAMGMRLPGYDKA